MKTHPIKYDVSSDDLYHDTTLGLVSLRTRALLPDLRTTHSDIAVGKVILPTPRLYFGMHITHSLRLRTKSIGLVRTISQRVWDVSSIQVLSRFTGFYVRTSASELTLGPFHGRPACQSIALGRGVCGTAAAEKRIVRVRDVDEWPGHIACDTATRSEVVVPIIVRGEVVALIDVDCAAIGGFDEEDESRLESLAKTLGASCDWDWNRENLAKV